MKQRKLTLNNTYSSCKLTFLIFRKRDLYTGVCLEFDLVVQAPTWQEAKEHIEDLADAWLKNVLENRLPESLLNKPAPKKYWDLAKKVDAERLDVGGTFLSSHSKLPSPNLIFFSIIQRYFNPQIIN